MASSQRDAFAAAVGGPRLRGRPEADPEGMAACGQSLEGFAQMQCWPRSDHDRVGAHDNSFTGRASSSEGFPPSLMVQNTVLGQYMKPAMETFGISRYH